MWMRRITKGLLIAGGVAGAACAIVALSHHIRRETYVCV